jgi:hypothetical protein
VVSLHLSLSELHLPLLLISHLSIFKLPLLTIRVNERVIVNRRVLLLLTHLHLTRVIVEVVKHLVVGARHESLAIGIGLLANLLRSRPIYVAKLHIISHHASIIDDCLLVVNGVVEIFDFLSRDLVWRT